LLHCAKPLYRVSEAVNGHKESVAKIDFEDLLQAIHCDR
jgi:hypothetical protein